METTLLLQLKCHHMENLHIFLDNQIIDLGLWKEVKEGEWETKYRAREKGNLKIQLFILPGEDETIELKLLNEEGRKAIANFSVKVKKGKLLNNEWTVFLDDYNKNEYASGNDLQNDIEKMALPGSDPSPKVERQTRSLKKKMVSSQGALNYDVLVYFATDRKSEVVNNEFKYGVERGELSYGTVRVSIPKNKLLGEIPRPRWWKLEFRENPEKHVMILERIKLEKNPFFEQLAHKVAEADENDAFIFVHGYNVSFDEAAMRTAQIAHDVGFLGAPIFYSWPSRASLDGYFSDEDNVVYSQANFYQFLKDIREYTRAKKIHLIAHSMGNRALTSALMDLHKEHYFDDFQFSQIILAAPDIDAQIFKNNIAPRLSGASSGQVTLYVSEKDNALIASRFFRKNLRRVGDGGADLVCSKGIETIDASQIDTDLLGHGYFAETRILLDDISKILKENTSPENRQLKRLQHEEFYYWTF